MIVISRFAKRPPFKLLLALPVLFYLAVAVLWQAKGLYPITGDEPVYLLATDSLARDGDFMVRNNLFADSSLNQEILKSRGVPLSESGYLANVIPTGFPTHSVGIAFILFVPYYIGGVAGAKIFLALLAGLFPLLFYRVAHQIVGSEFWSVVIALPLALGLPFLAASNQVFPDLVGGLIILFVAERIVRILTGKYVQRFMSLSSLGIGVLIAFLPWLHERLGPPAVVLLLGYAYAVLAAKPDQTPRPRWRYLAIPAATFALSLALLFYYNHLAANNIFGLKDGQDIDLDPKKVGMIFLGLHWDRLQGMFIQQPLLLLGLVGVVPLIKASRRVALLLGALYLSVLLVVSLHPFYYYGGGSFVGRFWWPAVALWVFPLSYAVKLLLERNKAVVVLLLCAFSIILQGLYAATWLLQDKFLLNGDISLPNWARSSFYDAPFGPKFWIFSPTFADFGSFAAYLKQPSNYVFVAIGLLLIASGWLWQRGSARLAGVTWVLFLPIGIGAIMLLPPVLDPVGVSAEALASQTGTPIAVGKGLAATEGDKAGYLIHGPYRPQGAGRYTLPPGKYEYTLKYESRDVPEDLPAAQWSILSPRLGKTIAQGVLPPSTENGGEFRRKFSVKEALPPSRALEFRVEYPGYGYLRVERVILTPLSIDLGKFRGKR